MMFFGVFQQTVVAVYYIFKPLKCYKISGSYFCNSFLSYLRKGINLLFLFLCSSFSLNILTYPLIIGNIKTNCLKCVIKHLELIFVITNFDMTISSTLTSHMFLGLFCNKKFFFCYLCLTKSWLYYIIKNIFVIIF